MSPFCPRTGQQTKFSEQKKNTMENMTKEQDDELKQDIHAFTLVKALDLLDDCHHYLKANPPSKETMNYNKWENLVEETDYMREYNAEAAHERANSDSGSVAAPKEEEKTEPYFHLSKNEYGKMWLMYKPEGNGRYKCWEPITEEFWNEFENLLRLKLDNKIYQESFEKLVPENTALREALKELLPIAERYEPIPEYPNDKAIIERARNLILK